MITTCLSCLTTGGPNRNMVCRHRKLTRRIREGPKEGGDDQPPRILRTGIHLGWEMCAPPERTLSQTMGQARWLARDNPETNPITIESETESHLAEQFSWVPLLCCSPPGCPFPIKSFALAARVSPWTIHFQVLDKSPLLGPGRGLPSWNKGANNISSKINI